MFGHRFSTLGGKPPRFPWWPLVLVFGLGLLLLFAQSETPPPGLPGVAGSASPAPTLPSPSLAASQAEGVSPGGPGEKQSPSPGTSGTGSSFLPEYDPDDGLSPGTLKDTESTQSLPAGSGAGSQSTLPPDLAVLSGDQSLLGSGEPMGWAQVLLLAAKLLLVIGLVYAALAGLRWLQRLGAGQAGKLKAVGGDATICVLETTGLAPGRALHLVVVGEKTLLIGATDHQLSLLAELSNETADKVSLNPGEAAPFEQVLSQGMLNAEPKDPNAAGWQAALNSVRAGVQRIRETVGG